MELKAERLFGRVRAQSKLLGRPQPTNILYWCAIWRPSASERVAEMKQRRML